jgi:hypothetical protein
MFSRDFVLKEKNRVERDGRDFERSDPAHFEWRPAVDAKSVFGCDGFSCARPLDIGACSSSSSNVMVNVLV